MAKNKNTQDPGEKLEIAKRIANQSKRVTVGYENFEASLFRFLRFMSSLIDKFFFSQKHLGLVSLIMACFLYLSVNYDSDTNALTKTITNAKILNNVTVSARYNDETFEISGAPTSCQVVITGDAASVNSAASKSGMCVIDLEGYTEGTHSVPLKASGYGSNVNAIVTPSETQITLKRKTTAQFALSYDYINTNLLDSRFILSEPSFKGNTTSVNIRASQDTLDSIAMVKALIDVKGQTSDFTISAPLVAYNSLGQVVNAEIDPQTVEVSVSLSSPHKAVPITLNINGNVPDGISIDSIQMDHQSAVIYAPESVLSTISELPVTLNVSSLISDGEITIPLTLPGGVSSSDVSSVSLKVHLGSTVKRTIENIPIVYRNNDNGYGASEISMTSVSVTVSGTENNIAAIQASDITVFIDVKGLETGSYDLPLQVEYKGNAYVNCALDTTSIHITLVANG